MTQECIKRFAEKAYTEATASLVMQKLRLDTEPRLMAAAVQLGESKSEVGLPQDEQSQIAGAATGPNSDAGSDKTDQAVVPVVVPAQETARDVEAIAPAEKQAAMPFVNDEAASAITAHVKALESSIPSLAFGVAAIGASASDAPGYHVSDGVVQHQAAGALLHLGEGVSISDRLLEVEAIPDQALKSSSLSSMLTLYSHMMTEAQIAAALNALYATDKEAYQAALIIKLPGLLRVGDLERAKALRGELLEVSTSEKLSFSMLGYVVSCYTMAGLKQDAGAIVQDALLGGNKLSPDDGKLIGMSISVANGSYPMMQEFYDYRSDEVRLHAYITIAVIARQLGRPEVAQRAVADAVKFVQKSAVKLDREKALAQILIVAPGAVN
ncbi:hypothetical protein ACI77O_13040 [Pseudomonas tritici]|uniref:hypothetical protein n=1 Tax=Pseudomonas tritici TaxID=2745518 RepID=UPI00387B5C01